MSEEQNGQPEEAGNEAVETPATGDDGRLPDDHPVVQQLAKANEEAKKYRLEAKKNSDAAKKLEEIEEAQKSEVEKAAARAEKAEQRAAEAETQLLRSQVAIEKQLPERLTQFLTGTEREELEAQADVLLEETAAKERAPSWRPSEPVQTRNASTSSDAALNGDPLLRDVKKKLGIS
jgi:hypothetical protein